jgi:hypothetical protein
MLLLIKKIVKWYIKTLLYYLEEETSDHNEKSTRDKITSVIVSSAVPEAGQVRKIAQRTKNIIEADRLAWSYRMKWDEMQENSKLVDRYFAERLAIQK